MKVSAVLVVAMCSTVACKKTPPPAPTTPPEIEVVEVLKRDVPIVTDFVGTLEGEIDAEIRARVAGLIVEQKYREGSVVKKDEVLFVIDPKPFEAAVKKAAGELAKAKAALAKADADVSRYAPLAAKGAVSKQELEHAEADAKSARAQVTAQSAALESAKLDLGYTQVRAPIGGVAGIARVKVGNFVGKAEPTLLTTVSQLDPIRATFAIPEQTYLRHANEFARFAAGKVRPEVEHLQLVLADGSVHSTSGTLLLADRQVDKATGTIRLQAQFPNPNLLLRPGQFGKVRFARHIPGGVLLVPQRAVQEQQGTYQVARVGPDSKVEFVPVKPGPRLGAFWAIDEGLREGDRVVYEAIQKVKTGMPIRPKPVQPDLSSLSAPSPAISAPTTSASGI